MTLQKTGQSHWTTGALKSIPGSMLILGCVFLLYQLVPTERWSHWHTGMLVVGVVGVIRYLWLLTNQLRAFRYTTSVFPQLRQRLADLPQHYPRRLYVIVPSYREDPLVTERSVTALCRELASLPSEIHLFFSVATAEEVDLIHGLLRKKGRRGSLKTSFLYQSQGKRMALGQALRATSREFLRVRDWHHDAHNDIVVLMDGDTELQPDALKKSLPFFRLLPDLGALTTHEEGHMIGHEVENSLLKPWFDLKFAKRNTMMSSHALSGRVLTLTGRFSVFRAAPILEPKFISRIECDIVYHWAVGRLQLLMGDDKSTWFELLSDGWRMLYLPDVRVNCLETRGGSFFQVSRSLMFRWFGNMARNNWRALSLGPRRMPFFIWVSILDQRLSMWTSLIGPTVAILTAFMVGIAAIAMYGVWVLLTRLAYLWLLVPRGFVVRPTHVFLQIYDQWVGSATKVAATMLLHRQSWAKGASSKRAKVSADESVRDQLAWGRLFFAVLVFLILVSLMSGVLRIPGQFHLISVAQAAHDVHAVDYGVVANDDLDDAPALQALLDRPGVACVHLPAGQLDLGRSLLIKKNATCLLGQGSEKTALVAHWHNAEKRPDVAILHLQGQRGAAAGALSEQLLAGGQVALMAGQKLYTDGSAWWHWAADNDAVFLDTLGSAHWRQARPALRQWIGRAQMLSGKLYLLRPVLIDLPSGTQVHRIKPLLDIRLEGFSLRQSVPGHQIEEFSGRYENAFPDYVIDGVRFDWVANSLIKDLKIIAAGRHPLVLEHSAEITVESVAINGAWNKGPGGNGYLRLARSFNSNLSNIRVSNIRHLAFQWSSSGNIVKNSFLQVDVNFHGGYATHNQVRGSRIVPDAHHPWPAVVHTKRDARWAPPDGPGNRVE